MSLVYSVPRMYRPATTKVLTLHAKLFAAALGLSFVVGCGSTPPPRRFLFEVATAAKANRNSPVPVTLVAIQDAKLFDQIIKMTAKQWYEQREQMRRDYPSGTAFTEWDWEFVPGQATPSIFVQVDGRAVGGIIFAKYRAPGDHRFRIGPHQRMRLDLLDDSFTVTPLDVPEE
jgi:type VI secretion system protein